MTVPQVSGWPRLLQVLPLLLFGSLGLGEGLGDGLAWAQTTSQAPLPAAPSPGAPAGIGPGATAPVTAAAAPPGIGPSGGRLGAAEMTIVGGNVASARERALGEALKQAVDQELSALVPEARTTQAKTVIQVLGRARRYVRRYRTLEEGESAKGIYSVRIEAEVDETALLRAFDKSPSGTGTAAGATGSTGPAYFVVGAGAPDAVVAATRAFAAAGARVQAAPADIVEPARAMEAAARAGIVSVAFVSGTATAEGQVRGPAIEAVTCALGVRVLTSGSGLPVADDTESIRSFADRVDTARADCFARAAGALIPRVIPVTAGRTTPDLRAIVIDVDVIEAGAVPGLLRQMREIGSVSAVDVRRVSPGRVELWVRSRLTPSALGQALTRDTGSPVIFSGAEVTGDLVRVRARLRDLPTTPGSAATGPALPPSSPPSSPPGSPLR